MGHEPILTRHVLVISLILICGLVPDRVAGPGMSSLRDSFKSNLFNRADLERFERGYYEELLDQGRRLDDLADVPGLRVRKRSGSTWSIPVEQSPLLTRVDDLREVVLKRNDATERFGLQWRTNDQGMRDRNYSVKKPKGTFRVALVGDSIGAGWGVNAEDRFESILEEAWNLRARDSAGGKVEIINCAVPGHSPGQRWYHFGQIGWSMEPDLVIYQSTAADVGWDERRLRFLLARGIGWDCPIYRPALESSGARPFGSPDQYKRALHSRHWDILAGAYKYMAADCKARGVPIVWVLIPRVGRKSDAVDQPRLIETARAAGFSRIIDLTGAFDDLDPAKLAVDRDDFHPNRRGHARLAQRLDQAVKEMPEMGRIWGTTMGQATDLLRPPDHDGAGRIVDEEVRPAGFRAAPGGPSE
jgi:GDSL-like lipase/acylhydrolase family protein